MRIIAGQFRGRRLKRPEGTDLRPTSDRLKETLFDILGPEIRGATVLDIFAGTGAIGLEALSRGARTVVFIESNREAAKLIHQNLGLCGINSGFRIIQADVFKSLRTLACEGFREDIAFLDPPYRWGPYRDLLATLFHTGIAAPDSRVMIEHHRKADLPPSGDVYRCVRTVRQGDKCLSFYQAESTGEAEGSVQAPGDA
jgi:16S rRNA (guanine(966)-N(2))-methyltransferase RsmD